MKTLAIRLDDDQHARLTLLAKVTGDTVTDVIRTAVDHHLDSLAADSDIAAKAQAALEAMDREISSQRQALATLIGTGSSHPVPPAKASRGKATPA